MKLGDKMTAVEASCGLWEEACPRKTRPPRIGDIPRYTAVDEESPGRLQVLPVSLAVDTVKKSNEMLEFRLQSGVHGDVFSSNQLTVEKSQNSDNCEVGIAEGRVPAVTVVGDERFANDDDIDQMIPEQLDIVDSSNNKKRGSLLRICSTPSQEICEVRKDSALYLEEVEGLKDLRESLRSRGSVSRSLVPRRESSGYSSNLGTFDDDRRGSETDLGLSKERRRSSTKNKLTTITTTTTTNLTESLTKNVKSKSVLSKNFQSVNNYQANDYLSIGDLPSYAEVLASKSVTQCTGNKSKEVKGFKVQSFDNEIPSSSSSSSSSSFKCEKQEINSLPLSKTKIKRMIVHQYSTPNFSSIELESISEKVCENNEKNIKTISSLPKSVKVYQLLSTQSEDRGDGDTPSNLNDRRISLQINHHHDDDDIRKEKLDIDDDDDDDDSKSELLNHKKTLYVQGENEEQQQPLPSTSTRQHLTPSFPIRKLSTPGEMGGSQRIFTGESPIGIRPIYPYCPYSPYGSPQGSPRTKRRPLRESRRVSIDNRQGALQLNQYKLLDNIGQGSYGIVKLAYNEEDETHYAMKILSKKKLMKKAGIFGRMAPGRKGLANPLAKVYREIALLKKLDHPNVVKLVEVLDDPDEDNLYLVFELVQKGEVLQLPTDQPFDEETARTHFRDIVLGVEYLHYQRIVHRDIKPSNLLVDSEGRVKVADLGVSAELRAAGELLSGPAGTPAFAAPETTIPGAEYSGTLCDVWSMGVTLYSLVTGKVPWDGSGSIIGVQAAVRSEPLRFPDKPNLSATLKDLISRMLEKEPEARLSISEIKNHPWVTRDGNEILPSEADNCRLPVTVTDEEVARVVTRVPKLDTLILIKTMLKQHSFQNPFLPKRNAKSVSCEPVNIEEANTTSSSPSVKSKTKDSLTASENSNTRAEKFHEAGRSNSAPDTFECHLSERQGVSVDNPLPPVTEASTQEISDCSNSLKSDIKR